MAKVPENVPQSVSYAFIGVEKVPGVEKSVVHAIRVHHDGFSHRTT